MEGRRGRSLDEEGGEACREIWREGRWRRRVDLKTRPRGVGEHPSRQRWTRRGINRELNPGFDRSALICGVVRVIAAARRDRRRVVTLLMLHLTGLCALCDQGRAGRRDDGDDERDRRELPRMRRRRCRIIGRPSVLGTGEASSSSCLADVRVDDQLVPRPKRSRGRAVANQPARYFAAAMCSWADANSRASLAPSRSSSANRSQCAAVPGFTGMLGVHEAGILPIGLCLSRVFGGVDVVLGGERQEVVLQLHVLRGVFAWNRRLSPALTSAGPTTWMWGRLTPQPIRLIPQLPARTSV